MAIYGRPQRSTALLCLLALAGGASATTLSDWSDGVATFFGGAPDGMNPSDPSYGTLNGACGYGLLDASSYPYFATGALSLSNQFFEAGPIDACGQCFEVQCAAGSECYTDSSGNPMSVNVVITDKCPECEADHLDLQALTWAKLADPSIGRIAIQYRRIECTPPADIKLGVLNYNDGSWVRFTAEETGGRAAVAALAIRTSGTSDWTPLTNTWGSVWEAGVTPPGPLDIQITGDDGTTLVSTAVIPSGTSISTADEPTKYATGVQFTITSSGDVASASLDDSSPSPPPPPSSTPPPPPPSQGRRRLLRE